MSFIGFANPIGLLGLLSIPAIIVLHMLRERSKHYRVSSLSLWSFLDIEVRGSRLRKIPLTRLLLLDLSIALLLSLAWAQPHITLLLNGRSVHQIMILLDVSSSMLAEDIVPSRFSQAQLKAISLISSLGPRDSATVVTFGSTVKWIGNTSDSTVSEILNRITNLQAGETGNALPEALALALSVHDPEIPFELHILTDAAFSKIPSFDESESITWHIFSKESANQAVLRLSSYQINENQHQLFASIANFSTQPANRVISLLVDEVPVDSTTLKLNPESIVSQVWTVAGKPDVVNVILSGGDYLPQDDVASLGMHKGGLIRVALVTDSPSPVDRALHSIPNVTLRILSPREYFPGMQFDIVVFRQTVPEEWPNGVILVLDPPKENHLLEVEDLVSIEALPVVEPDPLLDGVDLSGISLKNVWKLKSFPESTVPLIKSGDLPILARTAVGNSTVYLLLADLDSGNLTRHPVFPILIDNLIQSVIQNPLPSALDTGLPLSLLSPVEYPFMKLTLPDGNSFEFGRERPTFFQQTQVHGVYRIEGLDAEGRTNNFFIGLNSGNQTESDIRQRAWATNLVRLDQDRETRVSQEVNLMPWLLGLAILLLFMEAWLSWR
jgi:Ca-activated chloride channel homolog